MDTLVLASAGLAGVAAAASILSVRALLGVPKDAVLDRVQRVTRSSIAPELPASAAPGGNSLWARLLAPLSSLARPKETEELSRVRMQLVQAGIRGDHSVEVFYGSKLALSLALAGTVLAVSSLRATAIAHVNMLAVVLAAVGFYAPNVWLRHRVKERKTAISQALPNTLDLLVTCVEAGLGMDAALGRITQELGLSAPELASELRLTTMEVQAGVGRADAFRRLADRSGLDELRSLSAMVIQTEMFGTSIARALRIHASSMRTRRTHRAEEQAAMAAVKMMLPLVLCILPSLFAIILGPAVVRILQLLMPTLAGGHG